MTRGALGRAVLMVALLGCFSALITWVPFTLIRALPRSILGGGFPIYSILSLLAGLLGLLAAPLGSIAYTLLYYDQRSRSEGYDLELRLEAARHEQAP